MPPIADAPKNSAASTGGDLSSFFSKLCTSTALTCGFIGLAVGLGIAAVVYIWCKPKLPKNNKLLQKEEEEDDMVQVVTTLKEELDAQRRRLNEQLDENKIEREKNKRRLQTVETEITEREKTLDKPEELLREKQKLLADQWKLDETKKHCERQMLNIEKILEPIEIQVAKRGRKKDV